MLRGQSDTWTSCNLPGALIKSAPVSYRILVPNLTKNSVVIIIDSSQQSLGLIWGIRYDVHHPAI